MKTALSNWIAHAERNDMQNHLKWFWIIQDKLTGVIKGWPDRLIMAIDWFEKEIKESDDKNKILEALGEC